MKIIPGPASRELGEKIAALLGVEAIPLTFKTHPDGESYVRLEGSVKNEEVVIIQTTSPPQDTRLMQLAFIVDAAKRHGTKKVTAVVPYLAYARQDKIFLQGEAVSIEAIAQMLNAVGVDSLITVNVHQEKVLNRFPFQAKNVSTIPLLAEYFKQKGFAKAFALAPDMGAIYIAEEAKKVLDGECGYLEKHRDRYTGQISVEKKTFNVKGKTVIIFDDIISTGGTIVAAAKILKELGAGKVFAACAHPLLIGDAEKRILEAGVEEIVGTDSVPSHVSKVSLAPLIAKQLKERQSG
ncbi:MAG: ribose-phosphate diphosphokinase [Candidatus Bathyarchaeota archaeon]|jgi:ribose-phosphate pyrophosphokinase|nr:ribose-phosphate diphosphokinase [Candidatus Bathyarchaeota archaeon A05DMB-5]MDH7558510.1 ribose-phosphate diphosphokinase [Candidatus Bathyarchaeota archaeon]